MWKIIIVLVLLIGLHSCFTDKALEVSMEANKITLESYNDISNALQFLILDLMEQLKEQGKDVNKLEIYLDVIEDNNVSVSKVAYELKTMIQSGILKCDFSVEMLQVLDAAINLGNNL